MCLQTLCISLKFYYISSLSSGKFCSVDFCHQLFSLISINFLLCLSTNFQHPSKTANIKCFQKCDWFIRFKNGWESFRKICNDLPFKMLTVKLEYQFYLYRSNIAPHSRKLNVNAFTRSSPFVNYFYFYYSICQIWTYVISFVSKTYNFENGTWS